MIQSKRYNTTLLLLRSHQTREKDLDNCGVINDMTIVKCWPQPPNATLKMTTRLNIEFMKTYSCCVVEP